MAKAKRVSMLNSPSPTPLAGEGKSGLRWLWLAGLVLLLDQVSKLAVIEHLVAYVDVIPLTSFFNLVHVHNTGAAFSLFADQPGWQRSFFVTVAAIASAVMLYLLHKTTNHRLFNIALALILGGAIGNVIDRIAYGYVIDFLDIYVAGWHWPAFNVADSAISIGAAMLIFDSLRTPRDVENSDVKKT